MNTSIEASNCYAGRKDGNPVFTEDDNISCGGCPFQRLLACPAMVYSIQVGRI